MPIFFCSFLFLCVSSSFLNSLDMVVSEAENRMLTYVHTDGEIEMAVKGLSNHSLAGLDGIGTHLYFSFRPRDIRRVVHYFWKHMMPRS